MIARAMIMYFIQCCLDYAIECEFKTFRIWNSQILLKKDYPFPNLDLHIIHFCAFKLQLAIELSKFKLILEDDNK